MMIRYKHVHQDKDRHGNVRIYFRRGVGHPKIRLHSEPGTPEFQAEYDAALKTPVVTATTDGRGNRRDPRPKADTLGWLALEYFAKCAEFRQKKDRTQRTERQIIENALAEPIKPDSDDLFRDFPLRLFTAKAMRVIRDRKMDLPGAGNNRLKAFNGLFSWAVEADLMKMNPVASVKRFRRGREGFHTWTIEEVRQFEARYPVGTRARLALALLLFTGVRRSDVVKLGRQMINDDWIRFWVTKGRDHYPKEIQIPYLPDLKHIIDATPTGNLTFLITEKGWPFTVESFGNWFRLRCIEAGVPGRAHGLRKAGATIAAENGATAHQLQSIFGWETLRQAEVYTRQARQKRLAANAMHLVVPSDE